MDDMKEIEFQKLLASESDVLNLVYEVGKPGRRIDNLVRRLAKLMEEVGELSEAMLSVTSKNNGKKKIWNDVSIEAIDVLIMAADIALTIPPDCTLTDEEWRLHLRHALTRKLRKWSEQLDENKTIT